VHEVRPAQRGALASLLYGESAEGVAAVVADGQVRRLMPDYPPITCAYCGSSQHTTANCPGNVP